MGLCGNLTEILPQLILLWGLSAGTGKLCIFGHLGLVFIWSCFVSCLLLLLYYVICAPVLTEGTLLWRHPQAGYKLTVD